MSVAGALVIAAVLSAALVPLADVLGGRLRYVKYRASAEGRRMREVSYASGVALALGALAGLAIAQGLSGAAGGVSVGGALLLVLGLADDRSRTGGVPGWVRLVVGVLVGLLAWGAGAGLHVRSSAGAAFLVSVVLLVAVPNAFAALDVMGGVAAATGAACGASLLALGLVAHQTLEAILAATVLGGCLGFVGLGVRRSRRHLGTGGSLFLGFLVALTALRLQAHAGTTADALAVLACLALPLADTGVLLLPRFLAAHPLWRPGTDHLAHRLSRLGLHRRGIIAVHSAVALAGGVAAVATVQRRSPLPAGLLVAAVVAGAAALAFVRIGEPSPPRRVRRAIVGAAVAAVALLAVSGVTALVAEGELNAARADLLQAESSLKGLHLAAARSALDRAGPQLTHARSLLSSPLTLPGRAVPGLEHNFAVAATLARSGIDLVAAGRQGVVVLGSLASGDGHLELPLANGSLTLAPFVQAARPAATLASDIGRAQRLVQATPSSWLLPAVGSARTQALVQLAKAQQSALDAEAATVLIPAAFGAAGSQTWVIGAEDNAEQRGRSGYMGSIGIATADAGHLSLGHFAATGSLPALPTSTVLTDPPAEYATHYEGLGAYGAWQNLTMSPSFASGADVLLGMLHAAGGLNASGVIGMDPIALARLLAVTGPVSVSGVPVPLTSANVVSWALNQAYFDYPSNIQRHDALSGVAQAVFERILEANIDPRGLATAVGKSLAGDDLTVYSTNPSLERLIDAVGIGGDLSPATGDYLLVVGQNQGENKMDYYARRSISYLGTIQPGGSEQVTLTIREANTASRTEVLPDIVGGARPDLNLGAGVDRTYLSALVPQAAVLEGVTLDGQTTSDVDNLPELGKRVFGTYLEVAPGTTSTVAFRYFLPAAIMGNFYHLTVQNQAMVNPDQLSVRIGVPAGYTIGPWPAAASADPGGDLNWSGRLTAGREIDASVTQTELASILGRL